MISGFKKEFMFFSRGGRLIGLILATVCLALSSPVMFGFMAALVSTVSSEDISGRYADAFSMFTDISSQYLCASTVEYVASIGSIVMLFIFMGSAGGEQTKRSVIIPRCSGLSPLSYALPKFIIYPVSVFIIGFVSVILGSLLSYAMFGGAPDMGLLALSGACAGLYMAFLCVIQFTVGLCTERPRLSVVINILVQLILPSLLSTFRVDKYNPMALAGIAESAAYASGGAVELSEDSTLFELAGSALSANDIGTLNVAVSVSTAIVFMVLLALVTLFVLSAKEIKNEGDDPLL